MRPHTKNHTGKIRNSLLTMAALLAMPSSWAASRVWTNTGTDYNTAGSWTGGVPGSGDNATFTGVKITDPNLSASLINQGLTFSSATSSGYTLTATAGQSLTLTNVGTGASAAINAANTSGTNTINAPLILGGAAATQAAFTQAAGGFLTINGNISSTNTEGILINGAGTVTLSGTNSYTGLTTVNIAAGRLVLSGNNTATTGGLTVTAGTLDLRSATALGSGTLTAGGTILNGSGSALTLTNATPITLGLTTFGSAANVGGTGNINFGTGAVSYSGVFNTAILGTGATYRFDGPVSNTAGNSIVGIFGAGNTMVFGSTLVVSSGTASTGTTFSGNGNLTTLGAIQNGTSGTFAGALGWSSMGTLTLGGANTYTGATSLNAGIVNLDYNLNGGTKISGSGTGGNLTLGGSVALNLVGGAVTENVGTLTLNAGANSINRTGGSTGKIVGTSLTRNAGSTLALSHGGLLSTTTGVANSLLTSTAGVIGVVGGDDWAAKDASNLNIVAFDTVNNYVNSTATTVSTGNQTDVITNVTLAAPGSTSTLRFNTANTRTIDATGQSLTLTQGGILVTPAVANNLTSITGGTLRAGANNALIIFQNNTDNGLTIDSTIADGSGASALIKSGDGLLTLTNTANTYTGTTFLNEGTLNIAAEGSLGLTPGAAAAGQLTMAGGTLQFGANNIALSANRGLTLINSGNTIDTNGFDATIAGIIGGSGSLTKTGTGTLFLTASTFGTNAFTGPLTIKEGIINTATLANANTNSSIGRGSPMNLASDLILDGGLLQYTGSTAASTNRQYTLTTNGGGFDASGTVSGSMTLSGNMTASGTSGSQALTLTGAGTGTVSGLIANGTGSNVTSVVKSGTGSWTLSAANTYTGTTTVSAGTLLLSSATVNSTIASSSVIDVQANGILNATGISTVGGFIIGSGQTLQGTGTVVGSTTIASGGILSAGSSPGTLTFSNNLSLTGGAGVAGSTAIFEGGDLVAVNGTLTLNNDWNLTLTTGFQDGGSVTLFTYTTPGATLDLTPDIDISGLGFIPSGSLFLTDTGSSIVLNGISVVPEPGTGLLLVAGVAVLALRRRR